MSESAPPGMETPRVADTRQVFDGGLIQVRVDTLQREDGTSFEREVVTYGQAVVLVPVDADGRLLLVRQYRHAVGAWLLELPAGGIDEDDASPDAAALRELREETGHRGTLERLGGMFLAPGYSNEYQHVFVAHDLAEDALEADEDEDLALERRTLDEALTAVDAGEIRDAKSIAGLLMYLRHTQRR
ncbi:MAG TPA: NUDIX hydrolase [Dehalococcoidia bacterium]|nr:NUDIX hydrolase [Dehalococcoidia bacterium]